MPWCSGRGCQTPFPALCWLLQAQWYWVWVIESCTDQRKVPRPLRARAVSPAVTSVLSSQLDCNVICVHWAKGAATPNYMRAAVNTRLVGRQVALLIIQLVSRWEAPTARPDRSTRVSAGVTGGRCWGWQRSARQSVQGQLMSQERRYADTDHKCFIYLLIYLFIYQSSKYTAGRYSHNWRK